MSSKEKLDQDNMEMYLKAIIRLMVWILLLKQLKDRTSKVFLWKSR
jgi:hypothetical protein